MEYDDLDHIHRDDLIKFYQRYYFPKNIMLAVYGDFSTPRDEGQAGKTVRRVGKWSSRRFRRFPPVTAKPAPGIYLAEKPDVTQTFFSIGELGGTLRDKDYPALQVAAQYSGPGIQQPAGFADPHQARLRL